MAPFPIGLLLMPVEGVKLAIFVMVLVSIRAVRLILTTIPFMIVVVGLIVVHDNTRLRFGAKRRGKKCERSNQCRA